MTEYLESSLNISGKVNNKQRMKFGLDNDQNPSCPETKGVSADVLKGMICHNGDSCRLAKEGKCFFAHSLKDLNGILLNYKAMKCMNGNNGKCSYGKKCRYYHDEEEKRKCGDTAPCTKEDWAALATSENQANNGNKTDDENVLKLKPPPGFQLKAYSEVAKANDPNDTGTIDKEDDKENNGNISTAFKESKSGFSEQGQPNCVTITSNDQGGSKPALPSRYPVTNDADADSHRWAGLLFDEDTTSQCESSNNNKNSACVCNGKYHIKYKGCILPEHQVPFDAIKKAVCRNLKWCGRLLGKECEYCHNLDELRQRFSHYKRQECSAVKNNAECTGRDHCRYYHCEREKRNVDTIIADDILRKAFGANLRTNSNASINDVPPDSVGNECSGSQDREGASVGSRTSASTPDRGPGSQVCYSCRGPDPLIMFRYGCWFHKTCYDDMNSVNAKEKCFRCKEPDTHLTFRGRWFHLNCFNQMNELFAKK
ncbi:hypothetical protein MP638_001796 [Amoeboaphelidium occidentale]|nr:hypothetical protein MP638_001796 [Amoeboaphelidium occidentale]